MQVAAQVQTVRRYQQCASQQRNDHLGHDDKYLIWFIKEVDGLTRLNQTDVRSPIPACRHICIYIYMYIFIALYSKQWLRDAFIFIFYADALKTLLSVKNRAALSQRGGGGNARGAARGGEAAFSAPSLAITPILLLGTVKAVKSCWRGVTEPTAACSDGGISCVRRWLDYIISIILLGFTPGIEALALIWN